MKKVMISQLCRFYHGEKESPYLGDTSILWSTEKSFADAIIKNNKRVSFSEFHDHIIKAIRNRLPSDKERLLALYDGRYTEINQVVDKVWGEADKASQRQLSEIYAAIYGMDPEGKMEFIEKAMNNLRFDEDSFALKGYEDQNHWGYEGVSWVLKEATADYYWRNQDRLGDDLSDWILKDSLSFFLAMMMRDGLEKFRMEIHHGEAAPVKTELIPECLRTDEAKKIFDEAKHWFLITEDYKWNTEGGFTGGDCAYFCANVSRELNLMKGQERGDRQPIKWEAFDFFGYKRSNLSNYINHYENGLSRPRNASIIDQVVPCHIKVKEKFTHKKIR